MSDILREKYVVVVLRERLLETTRRKTHQLIKSHLRREHDLKLTGRVNQLTLSLHSSPELVNIVLPLLWSDGGDTK